MSQETGLKDDWLGGWLRDEGRSDLSRDLVLRAYGAGTQFGVVLPHSRKHELEADRIGVMLMAKAGYDPGEAPRFWSRSAVLPTKRALRNGCRPIHRIVVALKNCSPGFRSAIDYEKAESRVGLAKYFTLATASSKQKKPLPVSRQRSRISKLEKFSITRASQQDRFAPVLRSQSTPSTEWALGNALWVVEDWWRASMFPVSTASVMNLTAASPIRIWTPPGDNSMQIPNPNPNRLAFRKEYSLRCLAEERFGMP